MSVPMQVTPETLPQGFCPTSEQDRLNTYAANLLVTFPLTQGTFSYGNSVPAPDMQGFPWFRLNPDGSPDRWYVYFNGNWVANNPVAPNDVVAVRFFPGSYGDIATYDGGDTNAPGVASGPMWGVVGQTIGGSTDYGTYSGMFLLGGSASFLPGTTGGEAAVALTGDNNGQHQHTFNTGTGGGSGFVADAGSASNTGTVNQSGLGTPHNNMPPYSSVYIIGRTSRIFYKV